MSAPRERSRKKGKDQEYAVGGKMRIFYMMPTTVVREEIAAQKLERRTRTRVNNFKR